MNILNYQNCKTDFDISFSLPIIKKIQIVQNIIYIDPTKNYTTKIYLIQF